ncbi:hypothetical protein P168DRAFT_53600 [Aspergillus campestris IBT 28561]|uniref:Uncharacterized protein n=1 Tax=Aspergillus campestris (strain IBT 28561) TaxID=1392248 RepID=A0A2I1CVI6_ASPC2|nr:uncharacterized protein P168DRAFT_53600 [Aspergillus campestris IBT 28561]PKY01643.1 hypothetical protein P168DRAFT_53600 [Aspergillus campestris IBT 28561]
MRPAYPMTHQFDNLTKSLTIFFFSFFFSLYITPSLHLPERSTHFLPPASRRDCGDWRVVDERSQRPDSVLTSTATPSIAVCPDRNGKHGCRLQRTSDIVGSWRDASFAVCRGCRN